MPHEPERPPGAFFCTHFAIEQCPRIQFGRERCNTLLKHYRSLPIQVNVEHPMDLDTSVATHPVQKYCTGKGCVAWLAHKSLTWALLHLDTITVTLSSSESALVTVLEQNKLDTRVLQTDFEKATQKDCDHLKAYLTILQNTDASSLASILQSNEHGNPYTAKELATAFTKRVRSLELIATETDELLELAAFLRVAAAIFQRLSGRSPDFEIQPWSVTSLDVDFDADDCRVIGHGAFARVAEGRWNGKLVAVKETCPKLETTNERAIETIRHEVQLWSRLTHPNILPFYGACLEAAKPFIVSQLCASGNALRYLKQCPSASRINLLHDVSVGMIYLHDQGIIHADLKASNILIGPSTEALIADFGLSQIQDQVSSSIHITRTSADRVGGTFRWMAPEVLEGRGLNKPADLYGFALIAWEFYTGGAVPFGSVVDAKVFSALVRKGERPGRPEGVDEGVWGLVERCWKPDPSERPDFGEVERILEGFMAGGESERTSRVSDDAAAARGPISCPTLTVSHRSTTFPGNAS
ncbi:kinase-like domain-containing protein [Lyophyllum atratum]|nr:kinase-like domain-containing protein [Lyophyllum atratum]